LKKVEGTKQKDLLPTRVMWEGQRAGSELKKPTTKTF